MYFSTLGGGNKNKVTGVGRPWDDADVYTWDGASCGRALDASAVASVPSKADIDGLTVNGTDYFVSFQATTTVGGVLFQDTDVAKFDGTRWTVEISTGLTPDSTQDVDAIHVP